MYGLKPSCAHTDTETLCSLRYGKIGDTVISQVFIFTLATKQVTVCDIEEGTWKLKPLRATQLIPQLLPALQIIFHCSCHILQFSKVQR